MLELCSNCGSELPCDAKFCPQCGTPVGQLTSFDAGTTLNVLDSDCTLSTEEGGTTYDVFLSYSHRDRDTFGMEYILRIKDEIESSLKGLVVGHAPKVFLDAEALHLGELWHSKIMASLRQCKVFVCLVSDQYLNSDYCARERLWWDAQQTRDGRFLDRPYPVYFVRLEDKKRADAKDLMAVEMDRQPWFDPIEFNTIKQKLQEEFIRERLNNISEAVKKHFNVRYVKSYCSILPPLRVNFVGRTTELRELYELCVNGKHPIIQAFGGVGKTELSVAYAYGFADKYPMGRFMFRMEGVKSWDEAFASAMKMEGIAANGTSRTVFEELNISSEKKDKKELHQLAAKAFLERATKGQLLILLDNLDEETTLLEQTKFRDFLCDNKMPDNIHILATTRGSFRFSEQESFLSYDLKNLKEDEAFEMLCLTGDGLYPFDKQPPDAENGEYQAAREVIRRLDGHAWSMEIISAFIAANYLDGQYTFAMELAALRKENILFISSENGGYRETEKAATSVKLLQPTLDKLATLELGEEIVELAVFAACFDPDEIPMYLLREYWQLNFSDAVCSYGEPFIYAVNKLVKYHLLRKNEYTGRMHRLVQSSFLLRKEKYHPKILKTLPECLFIPAKYWVSLLLQNPELIDICPQDGTLGNEDWAKLLADPVFAEKCSRELFDGHQWSCLLQYHPQYVSENTPWSLLNDNDWVNLLNAQPQFADYCDWNKLQHKLSGRAWSVFLRKHPQFANKCNWRALYPLDFGYLLEKQPQFADKCDWSSMDGYTLETLLKIQPQLVEWCDFRYWTGDDWVNLLRSNPQFADRCDWNKLAGKNWTWLLIERPELSDKCDWNKLDVWCWLILLERQPVFADRCDWGKLDVEYRVDRHWAWLLERQPQFADYCDWSKLEGEAWSELLAEQPQFADKCEWHKLDGVDWSVLLAHQPQFADKCEWHKLDGVDWAVLLARQPQFSDKCDWQSLDGHSWLELLEKQPQFTDKCEWNKLSGWEWARLLERQPQFADYCDWSKLDGESWATLLEKQPQFANKREWDNLNGREWLILLCHFPRLVKYCDHVKLDAVLWLKLHLWHPELTRPEIADKCEWSKLDGDDWVDLLRSNPQFAKYCDLNKLSEEDSRQLLEKYPQLRRQDKQDV